METKDIAAGFTAGIGIILVVLGLFSLEALLLKYGIKFVFGHEFSFAQAFVLNLLITMVKFRAPTKSKE